MCRCLIPLFAFVLFILTACGNDLSPTEELVQATDRSEAATHAAVLTPQRIEFTAEDGTELVGTFWAGDPSLDPAPGILLMHWNPGRREDWNQLATLLQGLAISGSPSPASGYAVFAFDFRGHGESIGSTDRSKYVLDGQAALEMFRSMPGVDPDRILLIGASIGSDVAIRTCDAQCAGVIALSPGDYVDGSFVETVTTLGDRPILCAAAEGDPEGNADICRAGAEAAQGEYTLQIYQGNAHAMQMFEITEEEPALTDLIFEWLSEHFPAR